MGGDELHDEHAQVAVGGGGGGGRPVLDRWWKWSECQVVVRKKNPDEKYSAFQNMVKRIFCSEFIRNRNVNVTKTPFFQRTFLIYSWKTKIFKLIKKKASV